MPSAGASLFAYFFGVEKSKASGGTRPAGFACDQHGKHNLFSSGNGLFHNLCINLHVHLCGVKDYASAVDLPLKYLTDLPPLV